MKKKFKIIAELGSVHDGKFHLAKKLIKLAAISGANVVKFQMHIAEEETLQNAPSPNYFKSETSVLTCEHNYHFNKFNLIKMLQKVGFNFKFNEK